jgi:hypothetical protein
MSKPWARWTFLTDKKRWCSMGASVNSVLESVWAASPRPASFTVASGGSRYLIDFDNMTQRNLATKFVRRIDRQMVLPKSLRLPAPSQPTTTSASAVSSSSMRRRKAPKAPKPVALPKPKSAGVWIMSKKGSMYRMTPSMLRKQQLAATKREEKKKRAKEIAAAALDKIVDIMKTLPTQEERVRLVARALPRLRNLVPTDLQTRRELKAVFRNKNGRALKYDLATNVMRALLGAAPVWH